MAKLEPYGYEPTVRSSGDWLEQYREQERSIGADSTKALERYEQTGDIKGCYWKHQVADGYALYRVTKVRPLTLQHVTTGDGYAVPAAHIRGLIAEDIKQGLDWDLRWVSRQ